ncbi:MAG: hypothetical protein IPM47_11995 [Sphingobacteriales bacterium]|nr:MAG: hypothetical protein IPM47_11995 [Sphingobacteriales bacterium]
MREQMPLILLALLLLSTSIFVVQKWHVLSWFKAGVHNSIIPILTPPSNQKPTDSTTKPAVIRAQELEQLSTLIYPSKTTEERMWQYQKDIEMLPTLGLLPLQKQIKIDKRLLEFNMVVENDYFRSSGNDCFFAKNILLTTNRNLLLDGEKQHLDAAIINSCGSDWLKPQNPIN